MTGEPDEPPEVEWGREPEGWSVQLERPEPEQVLSDFYSLASEGAQGSTPAPRAAPRAADPPASDSSAGERGYMADQGGPTAAAGAAQDRYG